MSERKRRCFNCRRCIRTWDDKGNCDVTCEIDGHYIGYVECFENWCRHWAKDKWQEEMCVYQPKDDRCKDIATTAMHILANALKVDEADTPQTEDYDFRDEQEYNDRWQTDCGWK